MLSITKTVETGLLTSQVGRGFKENTLALEEFEFKIKINVRNKAAISTRVVIIAIDLMLSFFI
jgi:hypothetical protein